MAYEATAAEIVRRFAQWEQAATHSMNRQVSASAPLDPPTIEQATTLLPRLQTWREQLEADGSDCHGRPVAGQLDMAAMGCLWEEWRDDFLDVRNGYRDVWTYPDPLYDTPAG